MAKKKYKSKSRRIPAPTPRRQRNLTNDEIKRYYDFVHAYLAVGQTTYLNAHRSALVAGYSENTAKSKSSELVHRPMVQRIMQKVRAERMAMSTIATPEEILETLTSKARALPDKLVDENGDLLPLNKLDKETLHGIAGMKKHTRTTTAKNGDVTTTITWEYKFVDSLRAADLLAKHHGLFEKDNAQKKEDPAQVNFVMMPTGNMTLQDWCNQAESVLARTSPRELPAPEPKIIDVTPIESSADNLDFLDISGLSEDEIKGA